MTIQEYLKYSERHFTKIVQGTFLKKNFERDRELG